MKERILMAGIQLIEERGLKFSMDDLARNLSVSKRTLYQCYQSKENLITTIINYYFQQLENEIMMVVNDEHFDIIEKVTKVQILAAEFMAGNKMRIIRDAEYVIPEGWEKITQFKNILWTIVEKLYEEGVNTKQLRRINFSTYRILLDGVFNQIYDYDHIQKNNLSIKSVLKDITDVILHGTLYKNET